MLWYKRPDDQERPTKKLGRIHVYTGDGKGKTTAALGVAMRAMGTGLSVLIIQFLKGHKDYGELRFLNNFSQPGLAIVQFGTTEYTDLEHPAALDLYLATQGLDYARRAMIMRRPNVLVLDEINPAMHYGLIATQDVLDFLDHKHQETEVLLTGRNAPSSILNIADIVTVMNSVKHPYDDPAFTPRYGIEH